MVKKISELEKIAYHEAGHAVANYVLRKRFTKASIIPNDESGGRVSEPKSEYEDLVRKIEIESYEYPEKTVKRVEKEIISFYSGPAAEEILTGFSVFDSEQSDEKMSVYLANRIVGSGDEVGPYLESLWERTKEMLSEPQNWAAVQALAKALLEEKEIGYRRARKIISGAM